MRLIVVLVVMLLCPPASAQSANYITTSGYKFPSTSLVAPGQVITLFVRGLTVPNAIASTFPLPTTLGGVSVIVKDPPTPSYPLALPILSVRSDPGACSGGLVEFCNTTAVTIQFPYEATCIPDRSFNSCAIGYRPPVKVSVRVSGVLGEEMWFSIVAGRPYLLNSCDAIFGRPSGFCLPLITHTDGSLVSFTARAHPGEVVTLYGLGFGDTKPMRRQGKQ